MKNVLASTSLLILIGLAACSQSPQPGIESASSTAKKTAASATEPAPVEARAEPEHPGCRFCAKPSTVRRCEVSKGVRTTLFWDVSDSGASSVVVYVVDKKGIDQHFGKGGLRGSKLTGPWLSPGIQFKIKDEQGQELNSLTIDGVEC